MLRLWLHCFTFTKKADFILMITSGPVKDVCYRYLSTDVELSELAWLKSWQLSIRYKWRTKNSGKDDVVVVHVLCRTEF